MEASEIDEEEEKKEKNHIHILSLTHLDNPTAQRSIKPVNHRGLIAKLMALQEPGYAGNACACAEPQKILDP